MSPDLDEESRAIGGLETNVIIILGQVRDLVKKVDRIDRSVTDLKIKVATFAGGISVITTVIVLWVESYLSRGGAQ